jgi:hypothetical protein
VAAIFGKKEEEKQEIKEQLTSTWGPHIMLVLGNQLWVKLEKHEIFLLFIPSFFITYI